MSNKVKTGELSARAFRVLDTLLSKLNALDCLDEMERAEVGICIAEHAMMRAGAETLCVRRLDDTHYRH